MDLLVDPSGLCTAALTLWIVIWFSRRVAWVAGASCDYRAHREQLSPNAFRKKTVWITGASSGIGKALAQVVDSHGGSVILSARRVGVLEEVARGLQGYPNRVCIAPVDLCNASGDDIRALVENTLQRPESGGKLDYLFNNAGASTRALADSFHDDNLRDQVNLNFISPITLTLACLPELRKTGGAVINTSSIASIVSTPVRAPYCAAKAALSRWHECLRLEQILLPNPVDFVDVCPGSVRTNIAHNAYVGGKGQLNNAADVNIENGLPVEYVAEKMAAAAVGRLRSVWIAKRSELLGAYVAYYLPGVWARIGDRILTKKYLHEGVLKSTSG